MSDPALPADLAAILGRAEFRYFPHAPSAKQTAFLLSPAFDTFYGGSAGGGKTDALLMRALLYTDEPGYRAALFRKTCPELTGSSGLVERSKDWLLGKGPKWNETRMLWTFPSGSTLAFGYCERDDDARSYQGHEFAFVGIDEAATWNRWPVDFLRSRVRRTKGATFPIGIGLTANPGGVGHAWIRERYIDAETRDPEAVVIRATIADNPGLDRAEYERTLATLPPVLRAQLLAGDWEIKEQGALVGREHLPIVDEMPADNLLRRVRFWDRAATRDAGCYTVGVKGAVDRSRVFYVEHVVRGQWDAANVDRVMVETANADGPDVEVDWEEEPGSSGIAVSQSLRRQLAGFVARGTKSTGAKWLRAQPFASYARAGNVRVLRGAWNQAWLDEITTADERMKGYVDQVDATSGAFRRLTEKSDVPGIGAATLTWRGRGDHGVPGYAPGRPTLDGYAGGGEPW